MSRHRITIYEDSRGEFRWTRKAANGEVISDSSEGYTRRTEALLAARRANPDWEALEVP